MGDGMADAHLPHALSDTSVVWIDIGGNRDYRSVVAALRACVSRMPILRLAVVKSRELRQLLMRFDGDGVSIARNLRAPTTEDDIATALVHEVECRGGQLPLELIFRSEHCSSLANTEISATLLKLSDA